MAALVIPQHRELPLQRCEPGPEDGVLVVEPQMCREGAQGEQERTLAGDPEGEGGAVGRPAVPDLSPGRRHRVRPTMPRHVSG